MNDRSEERKLSDDAMVQQLRAGRALQAPPDEVLLRAMAVWRPRDAKVASASPLARAVGVVVRRLQCALAHDSGLAPVAVPGLRASSAQPRQLLYSAQGIDIDLRIRPPDDRHSGEWQVSGQLLGPVGAAGQASLQCGSWTAATSWNEWCEFSFDAVPEGLCVLLLQGADWEAEIGPFDLSLPG